MLSGPRALWRRGRDLAMGLKLSLTLVAVVAAIALAIAAVMLFSLRGHLRQQALQGLECQMRQALDGLEEQGPLSSRETQPLVLETVWRRLSQENPPQALMGIFLLEPDGSPGLSLPPQARPSQAELSRLALGQGAAHLRDERDQAQGLVLVRGPQGLSVGVRANLDELGGAVIRRLGLEVLGATLLLCLAVGLFAAWLAQRELAGPLLRLTRQAELVAQGDLTPPEPLAQRRDELGRLSQALRRMTQAAHEMVQRAETSQQRFHRLFTDSRDAAFIIDPQGGIEDINPAGVRMFGYADKSRMLSLSDTRDLFAQPSQRRLYLETLARQGYVQDFPAHMRRQDGEIFQALITATARPEGQARFGLVRDVTEAQRHQEALKESEERYRRLVENAPDIIYRWSLGRRAFDYLSPAVLAITGYSAPLVLAQPGVLRRMLPQTSRRRVLKAWGSLQRGKGPAVLEQEYEILRQDGQPRWLRERSALVHDALGQPVAVEGMVTDVTALKEGERALREGQRMVEATLQGLPAAVMVLDRQHRVVHWNRAMEVLTGVPAAQMVGTSNQWQPFYRQPRPLVADLILDGDRQGLVRLYADQGLKDSKLIEGGVECEARFDRLGTAGERYLYFLAAPVRDDKGQVARAVETLVDFTDKRRLEEDLRRLSVTDELTGLYNHRFFYATLEREVGSARRYGQALSLLMLDLDHFKAYNDRFGHLEGDRLLAMCSREIRGLVRGSDLACRYGGEEFAVLLPHTSLDEAYLVAERVRQGVAALHPTPQTPQGRRGAQITISVGVAELGPGMGIEEVVARADRALYAAKNQGRNRVAVLGPGEEEAKVF